MIILEPVWTLKLLESQAIPARAGIASPVHLSIALAFNSGGIFSTA